MPYSFYSKETADPKDLIFVEQDLPGRRYARYPEVSPRGAWPARGLPHPTHLFSGGIEGPNWRALSQELK